jgi:predicted LPLAT superfamily acyltransferase
LLDCPVLTLFCVREGGHYALYAERLADRILLPRSDREAALAGYAAKFAERLASFAMHHPRQWYNFFDFWDPRQGNAEP